MGKSRTLRIPRAATGENRRMGRGQGGRAVGGWKVIETDVAGTGEIPREKIDTKEAKRIIPRYRWDSGWGIIACDEAMR